MQPNYIQSEHYDFKCIYKENNKCGIHCKNPNNVLDVQMQKKNNKTNTEKIQGKKFKTELNKTKHSGKDQEAKRCGCFFFVVFFLGTGD